MKQAAYRVVAIVAVILGSWIIVTLAALGIGFLLGMMYAPAEDAFLTAYRLLQ